MKKMLHPEKVTATEELLIPLGLAVEIKNNNDFITFLSACRIRGINNDAIERAEIIGFKQFHFDAGEQVIPYGELCLDYQIGKGFASEKRMLALKEYDYIISANDFANNIYVN